MTEKIEYITASINLLEQEGELNSTELAVLCNLKKFMYQSNHQPDLDIENNNNNPTLWSQIMTDHHPEFAVGKYYRVCGTTKLTYEVTPNDVTEKQETKFYVDHEDRFVKMNLSKKAIKRDKPATAEQITTFKCAEIKREIGLIIKKR